MIRKLEPGPEQLPPGALATQVPVLGFPKPLRGDELRMIECIEKLSSELEMGLGR